MQTQAKKALITGCSGQIGSYMAEYLLEKGYVIDALDRRKSVLNHNNIEHIKNKINIIEGDITDPSCIYNIIDRGKYDEIYNFAAMSHVGTSFVEPSTTFEIDCIGVVNILEAMKKYSTHSRMYQASTSELFGKSSPPQNETTPLMPQSPYGCAKLGAHHMVRIYHQSYKLRCACGIMFNSESSRRGVNFVTRKITEWVKGYKAGNQETFPILELGNLNAKRDWLFAKDSVDAIYRICNQDIFREDGSNEWKSYCFGSGVAYSVREFLIRVLQIAFPNDPADRFRFVTTYKVSTDSSLDEVLYDSLTQRNIVKVSEKFFRPSEVEYLLCDPTLIKTELGWTQKHNLDDIIVDMLK